MLHRISAAWARVEMFLAAVLAGAVTGLILLNVITRSMRRAIYWVDEAAIYAMVAMAFLAASAAIERREAISITLISDTLNPAGQKAVRLFVDVMTLTAAALLIATCWIWFAPLQIWAADFDIRTFQGQTFNFIYSEPTTTLGFPKFWVWLVMPVFALGLTLHAVSNLVKTLRGDHDSTRPAGDRAAAQQEGPRQ